MKIATTEKFWKKAFFCLGSLVLAGTLQAQTVTNLNPNHVISWNLDDWSTVNPTDLAGLAPATNWVDSYLNNITTSLPDNTGAATSLNLAYGSYNTYQVYSYHPGYDANGTANREMLNGFLNAGPAAWNPPTTNTWVALTNVPYAKYDVVVYFNSDTGGRQSTISDGTTTYSFSIMGSSAISGANALFVPTTQTNSAIFPSADFAFFPGETNANIVFTTYPKSGNDQWLGITGFQVIQSSNAYVLYGPSPASQIVPVGQPASFSVMAGGLNPAYQWQHAGTNILNATNAAYNIAATALGQDGNYAVIVSNSFNSVTSVVASLTFYTPKTVEWDGNGATWDTTSSFWTVNHGASTTNYTETDNALFDPLGAANSTVILADTFAPSSITASNASYELTGGGIDGSGSIHVENNGTLIMDTPSTSTGPILIDNGSTLQLDNFDTVGSLGSGPLTNNGALLFFANGDQAYGYPIYGSGSITNNSTTGTLTLGSSVNASQMVQSGAGTLLLQGNNAVADLVVAGGFVSARVATALATNIFVNGGELQLVFNNVFAGNTMLLNGGVLHGGISGANAYGGLVTLGIDSEINVDNASQLTLNNPAGLAGNAYNLTVNGVGYTGTLILAGTNNTWNSATISFGTLQIGNGGNGSLGGGTISDYDTLAFDLAGNFTVTNPISGSGNLNQIGFGTTYFTGDLSGLNGNVMVSAGGLGGNTTIGGSVSVLPGATLAPGTASAIGTLTINSDLTLGGNVAVKLNKSLAQSNDVVTVYGALSDTNSGVVTVNNLGPALTAGDKFTLFSQSVTGGTSLTVTGGGVTWSNNLANDGSIIVMSTVASNPTNITYSVSGGTLSLSWPADHLGWILQSQTNALSTGLSTNWTDVAGSAAVTSTNVPVNTTVPVEFYRLRQP